MKSPNHWAAFSQSAMGLQGCVFEWVGLASAGHLTTNGYHGYMKGGKRGNESKKTNWASLSQLIPAQSCVCLFECEFIFVLCCMFT